jgi:hypothetical protein
MPRGPRGQREAGQFGHVEADPGAAPVGGLEVHRQVQREVHDPGCQRQAGAHRDEYAELPPPHHPRIQQRVRQVDPGQGVRQLAPVLR